MKTVKLLLICAALAALLNGCSSRENYENTAVTHTPGATVLPESTGNVTDGTNDMTNGVEDMADSAGNAAGDIIDGAGDAAGDIGNTAENAAEDVSDALKNDM